MQSATSMAGSISSPICWPVSRTISPTDRWNCGGRVPRRPHRSRPRFRRRDRTPAGTSPLRAGRSDRDRRDDAAQLGRLSLRTAALSAVFAACLGLMSGARPYIRRSREPPYGKTSQPIATSNLVEGAVTGRCGSGENPDRIALDVIDDPIAPMRRQFARAGDLPLMAEQGEVRQPGTASLNNRSIRNAALGSRAARYSQIASRSCPASGVHRILTRDR